MKLKNWVRKSLGLLLIITMLPLSDWSIVIASAADEEVIQENQYENQEEKNQDEKIIKQDVNESDEKENLDEVKAETGENNGEAEQDKNENNENISETPTPSIVQDEQNIALIQQEEDVKVVSGDALVTSKQPIHNPEDDFIIDDEFVLTENLTVNNLYVYSGTLNLNGYELTVNGDLIQSGGMIEFDQGTLSINGDYHLETENKTESGVSYSESSGMLTMCNPMDKIFVKGSFYNSSNQDSSNMLTDGEFYVSKDFIVHGNSYTNFISMSNHRVILNGSEMQIVRFDRTAFDESRFSTLVIRNCNSDGIRIQGSIYVDKMIDDGGAYLHGLVYVNFCEYNLFDVEPVIHADELHILRGNKSQWKIDVYGDVYIESTISIGSCRIHGNVVIGSDGDLLTRNPYNLDGYSEIVEITGNFTIADEFTDDKKFTMGRGDTIKVGGDFIFDYRKVVELTGGTLEIQGNYCSDNKAKLICINEHSVLFKSEKTQSVNNTNLLLNNVVIENTSKEGIIFSSKISCNSLDKKDSIISFNSTSMEGSKGWTLEENQDINGDFVLTEGTLDLNGYTLNINGNFIQADGIVNINGGKLIVNKDYRIQTKQQDGEEVSYTTSNGLIIMKNEADEVWIHGDFYDNTLTSTKDQLTDGTLYLAGNMEISQDTYNAFYASNNHQIVFNGTKVQKVSIENSDFNTSRIANMVIENNAGIWSNDILTVTGYIKHNYNKIGARIRTGENTYFQDNIISADQIIWASEGEDSYQKRDEVKIDGSLMVMTNVTIDHDIVVTGMVFIQPMGHLTIESSKFTIKDSISIFTGYLDLKGHNACLLVEGEFYNYSSNLSLNEDNCILEVKGIFSSISSSEGSGFYINKLVLSGDKEQEVTIIGGDTKIITLDVENTSENGVTIWSNGYLPTNVIGNDNYTVDKITENPTIGWKLEKDELIEGNLVLETGKLDLNGHSLTVHGDLVCNECMISMESNDDQLIVKGNLLCRNQQYLKKGTVTVTGSIKTESDFDAYNLVLNGKKEQDISITESTSVCNLSIISSLTKTVHLNNNMIIRKSVDAGDNIIDGTLILLPGTTIVNDKVHCNVMIDGKRGYDEETEQISDCFTFFKDTLIDGNLYLHNNISISDTNDVSVESSNITITGDLIADSQNQHMKMSEDSSLVVKGNVEIRCGDLSIDNGALIVNKNIIVKRECIFLTTGNQKTVLSSEKKQMLWVQDNNSYFNILELKNNSLEGVFIINGFTYNQLIINDSKVTLGDGIIQEGEWILEKDEVYDGNLISNIEKIDLNGHKLHIKGDFIQSNGSVIINKGQLIVDKDYRMQSIKADTNQNTYINSTAKLVMLYQEDNIVVGGDYYFSSVCKEGNVFVAGEMKLAGDFIITNRGCANFCAKANHHVILNGTNMQTVRMIDSGLNKQCFANLTIQNKCKTYFATSIVVTGTFDDGGNNYIGCFIAGSKTAIANNICHGSVQFVENCVIRDITIYGDMKIGNKTSKISQDVSFDLLGNIHIFGNVYDYSNIKMSETAYLLIDGSYYGFLEYSNDDSQAIHENGTIEVKQNFVSVNFGGKNNNKVILSGDKTQNVQGKPSFQILENKNQSDKGIEFDDFPIIKKYISNDNKAYLFNTRLLINEKLEDDITINGNCLIIGEIDNNENEVNLNGHRLTVNGDLQHNQGRLSINCGQLYVNGYYTESVDSNQPSLIMNNPRDMVVIQKGFNIHHGFFDISDGFIQVGGALNEFGDDFCSPFDAKNLVLYMDEDSASDSVKTLQNIHISHPENLKLPSNVTLVITQDLSKGYTSNVDLNGLCKNVILDENPDVAPTKVENLKVIDSDEESITLQWSVSTDNLNDVSYEIFRDGKSVGITTDTEFTDKELIPHTDYSYEVCAVDIIRNRSEFSDKVIGTTIKDNVPPEMPTNFRIARKTGSTVTLEWTASTDNQEIAGYEIYRGGIKIGDTDQLKYKDTTAKLDTTYEYFIKAYDQSGNHSNQSASINCTFNLPQITVVSPTNDKVLGGDIIEFYIQYTLPGLMSDFHIYMEYIDPSHEIHQLGDFVSRPLSLEYNETGHYFWWDISKYKESGEYELRLIVIDEDGNKAEKEITYVIDKTAPFAPCDVTATLKVGTVLVSWNPSTSQDVHHYTVYRKKASDLKYETLANITDCSQSNYVDSEVETGENYEYKVTATDFFGQESNDAISDIVTVVADTQNPYIVSMQPRSGKVSNGCSIEIAAKDNISVRSISLYYGLVEESKEIQWILMGDKEANNGVASFLWENQELEGKTYRLKAIAKDIVGNESVPYISSNMVVDNQGIEKITGLKATPFDVYVKLEWNDVIDEDFAYFQIEQQVGAAWISVAREAKVTGCYIKNLAPNTQYTYHIVGYDALGNRGEASDSVTVTTTSDTTCPVIKAAGPASSRYGGTLLHLSMTVNDNVGSTQGDFFYSTNKEDWNLIASVPAQEIRNEYTYTYDWNIEALKEGEFYIKFVSQDANLNMTSESKPTIGVYIKDTVGPKEVKALKASGANGYIEISWETSDTDIDYFRIYRKEANGSLSLLADQVCSSNYYDTSIVEGVTYYYSVQAIDIARNIGSKSGTVSAAGLPDTEKPIIHGMRPYDMDRIKDCPTLMASITDNTKLSSVKAEYRVKGNTDEWKLITENQLSEQYELYKLTWDTSNLPEQSYEVRIQAKDKAGNTGDYYTVTYVLDKTKPQATNIKAVQGNWKITINWNNSMDSDLDKVVLYRKAKSEQEFKVLHQVTGTSYEDTDVTPLVDYSYYVRSFDKCGNYSDSKVVTDSANDTDTIPPLAKAMKDIMGVENGEIRLDGTLSTDNVGITKYSWNMGDGTKLSGVTPVYQYTKPGEYKIVLTVYDAYGNSDSCEINATIRSKADVGNTVIHVTDTQGYPLAYANMYIQLADGSVKQAVCDKNGDVNTYLPVGMCKVAAYKDGFLPNELNLYVYNEDNNNISISLEKGDLVTCILDSHRMTVEELVEAGISLNDPMNMESYTVSIEIKFEKNPIPTVYNYTVVGGEQYGEVKEVVDTEDKKVAAKEKAEITFSTVSVPDLDGNGGGTPGTPKVYAFVRTIQSISWLKNFYQIDFGVINNASSEFTIESGKAVFECDEHISLASTYYKNNTVEKDMGEIKGQDYKVCTWYASADEPGAYSIGATFSGCLQPFNIPVSASISKKTYFESPGEKLTLYVYAEDAAYIDDIYYIHFQLRNGANYPIYNVNTTFKQMVDPGVDVDIYTAEVRDNGILSETGKAGTYEYNEPPRIAVEFARDCKNIPVMVGNQTLYVKALLPGESLFGTFATRFVAKGDPKTEYYKYVSGFAEMLSEVNYGVEVKIVPIPSHIVRYNQINYTYDFSWMDPIDPLTGAFTDNFEALKLTGASTISCDMDYNSMQTKEHGDLGYGWTHCYENMIVDHEGYIEFYYGANHYMSFIPVNAIKHNIIGVVSGDSILIGSEKQSVMEYTSISNDTKDYRLVRDESSENFYTLYTPGGDVFSFNSDGKLIGITDANGKKVKIAYDKNEMTVTELASLKKLHFHYNNEHLITNVNDEFGREVKIEYSNNYITKITDPLGYELHYFYDGNGRIQKITNNDGITKVINTYDSEGRVIQQDDSDEKTPLATLSYEDTANGEHIHTLTNRNGCMEKVYYNSKNQLIKNVNHDGTTMTFSYDSVGNLIEEHKPYGASVEYQYNSKNQLITAYDEYRNKTEYTYDDNGNVASVLANGNEHTYEYNSHQLITKDVDEIGVLTLYTYNDCGQVLTRNVVGKEMQEYEYKDGLLAHTKDSFGKEQSYLYDDFGNLIQFIDASNNITTYEYDKLGRKISEMNPYSETTKFRYDSDGNQTEITNEEGTTKFTYENGYIVKEEFPDGKTITYENDPEGNTIRTKSSDGKVSTAEYDIYNNLVKEIYPDGKMMKQYKYDAYQRLIEELDANQNATLYTYYNNEFIKTITYPDKTSVTYTYTPSWQVETITDESGNVTSYKYDKSDHLISCTDTMKNTVSYTYDLYGNKLTEKDARGNTTKYAYNKQDQCIKITNALGEVTRYEYDVSGRLSKIIQETIHGEVITTINYDKNVRKTEIIDPMGNITSVTYNKYGNIMESVNGKGDTTQYHYNKYAQLEWVKDPMGGLQKYTYDASGNVSAVNTSLNSKGDTKVSYSYDKMDRLVEVKDPLGGVSKCTYDLLGNITSVTDPMEGVTTYKYDDLGRLVESKDAIDHVMKYTYNAQGLLEEQINANNKSTKYEYDKLGRIKSFTDELGKVSYTYDENGNVLTVTDKNGTIHRSYDALNRVSTYTDSRGNVIKYSYDELGNLLSLTYPGGKIVRYEYDLNGNLTKVIDWEGRVTSYDYNENCQIIRQTRPDGSVEMYEYDNNGRLSSKVDKKGKKVLQEDSYTYDEQGNVVEVSNYQQENPGQLTNVSMTYDKANRMVTYNGEAVTYDANGNMIYGPLNGKMVKFIYDCRNRLIQAGTTTYEYDAENQRIVVNETDKRYEYVIDSNAELSQIILSTEVEKDKTGTLSKEVRTVYYIYGHGLISQTDGKDNYLLYHYDHLGSTTMLTNESGKVVNQFAYGPYGELLTENPLHISFLYNGYYGVVTDSNTLYYMRARYYNSEIKRFINQDVVTGTISNSASLNRYSYVQGNPISLVDPFGLSPLGFVQEFGHSILSLIGMVPGIGDIFDGINGIWYLCEGNYEQFAVSVLSALPLIGTVVGSGVKCVFKFSAKVCKSVDVVVNGIKLGSRVYFGVTSVKNAGLVAVDMYEKIASGHGDLIGVSDVTKLGMNVFGASVSFKGIGREARSFGNSVSSWKNEFFCNKIPKAYGPIRMDLQFFAGKGGTYSQNPMSGDDWHRYFNDTYGADNVTWESASMQDIVDMPSKITDFSPKQIAEMASKNGWSVDSLGKGSLAGVPFEQGGGLSMHAPNGSSVYIQYHPGGGHHGEMPYYKVSSGKNGIIRYYLNGERAK